MLNSVLKLHLIATLALASFGLIENQENVTLTVEVDVTKHNKGQIAFALFDNAEAFLEKPVRSDAKDVKQNKVIFKFRDLPKGSYSFSYYHDLNANGELDTNFMGVPKEPYGFSNNQKGKFGPPDFEDAKILIDQNTTIQLTIK